MSRILCGYKLILLNNKIQNELQKGAVFASGQLDKILRFINFVTCVYIPWWFKAPVATDAIVNDIELLDSIDKYMDIDSDIAKAAKKAFSNHLWYEVQELAPLCLFSDSLSNDEKTCCVQKMCGEPAEPDPKNRFGNSFGKPIFPSIGAIKRPQDCFGPDSWFFFKALDLNADFINQPVESWQENSCYKAALETITSIKVVNDAAERGVKLASDFLGAAKKEDTYQHILQVVENDRAVTPNQRSTKQRRVRERWCLVLE